MKLSSDFYVQNDVVLLARELIGKVLVTRTGTKITSGIICETEAYNGVVDKASHAYGNRYTPRTETMYRKGGIAYIYLCYGIHHLFNVVTNIEGIPHAVLIRGILPEDGLEEILKRRNISQVKKDTGIGPGKVTSCLNIYTHQNGTSLAGNKIWIEDRNIEVNKSKIIAGPRVGVDYAGEDASLPYRFQYEFGDKIPRTK